MGDEEKHWPQGGVVGQRGCQPGPDTSAHSQPGVRAASLVGAGTARGENRTAHHPVQTRGTSTSFCDHYHQRSERRQALGGSWL